MLARRIAALFLVALVALIAFNGVSRSAGTKWVTKQIGWTGPGAGKALASGGYDTLMITDWADTQRTVIINTSDWAWEEIGKVNSNGGATLAGAFITITAQKSNGKADSLYAIIEPCFNGTCGNKISAGIQSVWTTSTTYPLPAGGIAANYTWAGGSAAYTTLTPPAIVFQGPIQLDPDTWATGGNAWLRNQFRLVVVGDVGGTSPQLNACRIYITYPQRSQP